MYTRMDTRQSPSLRLQASSSDNDRGADVDVSHRCRDSDVTRLFQTTGRRSIGTVSSRENRLPSSDGSFRSQTQKLKKSSTSCDRAVSSSSASDFRCAHLSRNISVSGSSTLVIFALTLLTSPYLVATQSASGSGEQYQLAGGNVTLSCPLPNPSVAFLWSKDNTVLFNGAQSFNSNLTVRYTVYVDQAVSYLYIVNVQTSDDGTFSCSRQNLPAVSVQLHVVVGPGQPRVTLASNNAADISNLYEGSALALNCSSNGGNPAPNITWYRNGQSLLTTSTPSPPTVSTGKFGTTYSLLTWTLTPQDNKANFSCLVSSDVVQQFRTQSQPVSYNVKYAPIISLGQYNPLFVIENAPFTLTCNVDANPPTNAIQWYKDVTYLSQGAVLNVQSANRSHTGRYTCVASNYAERNNSINVTVLYAPRLQPTSLVSPVVNGTVTVTEGSSVNITMSVDSNPAATANSFVWLKAGTVVGTGQFFFLSSVSRRDSGLYTLNATNTMASSTGNTVTGYGSGVINLNVLYVPSAATITLIGVPLVGSNSTLACQVSDAGNPPATMTWSRQQFSTQQFPTGRLLQLGLLSLSAIGSYTCQPVNSVGSGPSATTFLDVYELPMWTSPFLVSNVEMMVTDTSANARPTVQCAGRGRPTPVIQWYKNGQPLDLGLYNAVSGQQTIDTYSTYVTSQLQWQGSSRTPMATSLTPNDSGNYTCSLVSSISNGSLISQTVIVRIRYAPIMNDTFVKLATDASQSISLACRGNGYPAPSVNWTSRYGRIMSPLISVASFVDQESFVSVLNISSVTPQDFGVYTCTAANEMGSSQTSFNLTVRTAPEAPNTILLISTTYESIMISWQPGFDGGYAQEFVVSAVPSLNSQPSVTLSAGAASTCNITGLRPSLQYSIDVFAKNRLGSSSAAVLLDVQTRDLVLNSPSSVRYAYKTHVLMFSSSSNPIAVCFYVWILTSSSTAWIQTNSSLCPSSSSSTYLSLTIPDSAFAAGAEVTAVAVAACVPGRIDICSSSQNATYVMDEATVNTIIIVVCVVGGTIIIVLIIALICVCYRRKKRARARPGAGKATASPSTLVMQPMSASSNGSTRHLHQNGFGGDISSGDIMAAPAKGLTVGYDNPVLDETDLSDRFYLDKHHFYQPNDIPHQMLRIPVASGGPPSYQSHHSGSNSSDSGVSETPKLPRRIIHEVVV